MEKMPRFDAPDRQRADAIIERRRQDATTNIQWRHMQRLVAVVNNYYWNDRDQIIALMECSEEEWQQLVELMKV